MSDIANRVRLLRKALNLSQTKFGQLLDISMRAVQSYEGGVSVPGGATMERILKLEREILCDKQ